MSQKQGESEGKTVVPLRGVRAMIADKKRKFTIFFMPAYINLCSWLGVFCSIFQQIL